jgi:pterin-4a-carbinolamine dehydratase
MQQLNEAIRAQGIESEGWRLLDSGAAIERRYAFKDFRSGFSFRTQDYNTLGVILHTHDLGGLSHLDLLWAIEAERAHHTNFMTLG